MSSRRLIRIKVLQACYAHLKNVGKEIAESERDLNKSINSTTDLFYLMLSLLPELRHHEEIKLDTRMNKFRPTEEDLNPNKKFAENALILKLENTPQFTKYIKDNLIEWGDDEVISYFYSKMQKLESFQKYMDSPVRKFSEDKAVVTDILGAFMEDDYLYQSLEEKNIYWNSDFSYVFSQIIKFIKGIRESAEITRFPTIDENEEDRAYARKLLRSTLSMREESDRLIEKFTKNWNIERMSEMDRYIMDLTIAEWITFPEIPVKVTLNEYLEISKSFSSQKSNLFINGILDKILVELRSLGKINKEGRGLVDKQ